MKQEVRPSSARTTQLTMAVAEMNGMVQSGCNEVSALSQLAQYHGCRRQKACAIRMW